MNFDYKISEQKDVNIVRLTGHLIEMHQGDQLVDDFENLLLKDSNKFEFDLNGLTFINQSGLDILISMLTKARIAGGECIITEINDELKLTAEFNKMKEIFSLPNELSELTHSLK